MASIFQNLRRFLSQPPSSSRSQVLRADGGQEFFVEDGRRGGMSVVYVCRLKGPEQDVDAPDGVHLALKTFDERHYFDAQMSELFARETAIWFRLSDIPFICPLLSIVTIDKKPHLLMPAADPNPNNCHCLAGMIQTSAPVDATMALRAALPLALAMQHAAERIPGVVHGDIKPDNILLIEGIPHLSDFGLAGLSKERGQLGTPGYMAPELLHAGGTQSVQTDLFAFGATVAELLTGYVADRTGPGQAEADGDYDALDVLISKDFDSGLSQLAQLAKCCLARDPLQRPVDFSEVVAKLTKIGRDQDPESLERILDATQALAQARQHKPPALEAHRIRALLEQNQVEAAVALVKQIPDNQLTGELLIAVGSTWSLAGRDEEALGYFERFLQQDSEEELRLACMNEYGLSLRRLGRLDEALETFDAIADHSFDYPRKNRMARSNRAGVLMSMGRIDEAQLCLQWLVQDNPGDAATLGLYGEALMLAKKFNEAAKMFESAAALEPRNGQLQVQRAEALFRARRIQEALHAVDRAYELNYQSPQWIVVAFATHLVARNAAEAQGIADALERDVPADLARLLSGEVVKLLREFHGVTVEGQAQATPPSQDVVTGTSAKSSGIDTASPQPEEPFDREAYGCQIRSGEIVHTQGRQSYVDHTFTIDFYRRVDVGDFVAAFKQSYARYRWRLQTGRLIERRGRYRFARCAHCDFPVLTKSIDGEIFTCQVCGKRGPVIDAQDANLAVLAQACNTAIGAPPSDDDTQRSALIIGVWEERDEQRQRIADCLREAGYTPAAAQCGAGRFLREEMSKRNCVFVDLPNEVWYASATSNAELETLNADLDRILRQLRRELGQFTTASCASHGVLLRALLAAPHERIELLRELLETHPDDTGLGDTLVAALLEASEHKQAKKLAESAFSRSPEDPDARLSMARIAYAEGNSSLAISQLRQIIAEKPRHLSARFELATLLMAEGNQAEAHEHLNELRVSSLT